MALVNYGSPVRRQSLALVAILLCGLLSACNGLFYHPIAETVVTPDKVKVAYTRERVPTSDGESLAAWVLKAQGPKKGTILHFHGNAENMTTHFLFVAWMTRYGFDVVTFDYRGYGESSGSIDRHGSHLDALAILHWMERRKESYAIVAQSLGGAVAIPAVASMQPQRLTGLILDSTFASYRDVTRKVLGNFWLTWALQYPLSFLVSDDLSPVDFASDITVPVLQIHGTGDGTIPMSEAKALFDAFPPGQKTFLTLDKGQHTQALAEKSPEMRNKVLAWLRPFFNNQDHVDEGPDEN